MCGIVGLFLKETSLHKDLGILLADMLISMTDRGPDSAGIALYATTLPDQIKLTLQSPSPDADFPELLTDLKKSNAIDAQLVRRDSHAVLTTASMEFKKLRTILKRLRPNIHVMSRGQSLEIYKEVGLPSDVVNRFDIRNLAGSHGIGHTRMATESAVTTMGAHPFNTGEDQCLVHNGSLANHNRLRRHLVKHGIAIETNNDTEAGAAYLTWRMKMGETLEQALHAALEDLDGFFTFVVGTKDGFGVVRDPIACKPAVMAETDRYVAFGSEYRALVNLPEIETAKVWEPEPATVYFWRHPAPQSSLVA